MAEALAGKGEEEQADRHISQPNQLEPMAMQDPDFALTAKRPSASIIGIILLITVMGFTVQTEATAYYFGVLGWSKPFLSLYLSQSCLILPWTLHQLFFYRRETMKQKQRPWLLIQVDEIASLAALTDLKHDHSTGLADRQESKASALRHLLRHMAIATVVLTVSGVCWFIALSLTTPSDLTVIYNCSVFFAAIFSIPLLDERLTRNVVIAVAVSFVGTLMIAYGSGNSASSTTGSPGVGGSRIAGNMIAIVGASQYGLYCVLFKKWTSSQRQDTASSIKLTLASSGLTGLYSVCSLWLLLPVLHFTGVEPFTLPSLQVCFFVLISVVPAAVSMTLVVLLTAWTNPVFGNIAAVLCVFFVAIADWILFGILPTLATYVGGALIFAAFGLLSWDEANKRPRTLLHG